MNPLISIIIPVYNTGKSAQKLLDILKKSTYQNLEIICVDDCSTDNSLELLQKSAKNDDRVKIIASPKNHGAAAARNLSITKAHGEYISFIDSDDEISTDFIEKLYHALDQKSALSVCGFRYNRLNQKKSKQVFLSPLKKRHQKVAQQTYILDLLLHDGRLYSSVNKLYRTNLIKKFKIKFDEKLNFAEDTKFVLEYLRACFRNNPNSSDIATVLEPLYIYNFGTLTSTVKNSSLSWDNWQKSYTNLKKWLGNHASAEDQKLLKKILWRWKISHALAVARSPKTFRQKLSYVNLPTLIIAEIVVKFRN